MDTTLLELIRVVSVLGGFLAFVGLCLVGLNRWVTSQSPKEDIADRVNSLLPQIQCAQCGYPGCRPYAEAIVAGASIDQCPPGGEEVAKALANLLDRPLVVPSTTVEFVDVARIDEPKCVGCGLCLNACPVDAILGAINFMHVVLEDLCTGCEVCIPVCPVDCIDLTRRNQLA